MMLMMVFQGLRHPAPFSDDLEPVDKPYKRVSMDEATQGTSREWDFQKNVPSRFHQLCLYFKRRHQSWNATFIMNQILLRGCILTRPQNE